MAKLISNIKIIIYIIFITGCAKKIHSFNSEAYRFKSSTGRPDYTDIHYWAAHPWKWDPSDSIPYPLKSSFLADTLADVFFVYPTSLTDDNNTSWNAIIDDSILNQKTDYSSILYQASIFNSSARIFSPRYRQAHLRSFYTADSAKAKKAFDTAYADVRSAFQYYLQNWNNGRPIIIASHSQGTVHAKKLLKEFFDGRPLQNQLVCAYLVGMSLPIDYFSYIPPCKNPKSTGCAVSWRTFKRGNTDNTFVANESFSSIVVNPLNWTSDTTFANASLNLGGVLQNFNKVKPKLVDAQVHENILWSSKPKFFGSIFLTTTNYHIGDYNLFYMNIRKNVKDRIASFLLK